MSETAPEDVASSLDEQVHVIDPEPWLKHLEERYGIAREHFAPYLLFRTSGQHVTVVARDHAPPTHPEAQNIGIRLLRTHMRFPKLTTDAAMIFGRHATRNVIEVDADQAEAFMARETFAPSSEQTASCTGTGYVIVRHDGIVLGVGLFHTKSGEVESHVPKVRARDVEL